MVEKASPTEKDGTGFGRMSEAVKIQSDSYPRDFHKFKLAIYLAEEGGELNTKGLWKKDRRGNWFPPVDAEILRVVAGWFLDNANRATLDQVKCAVNHYYMEGLGYKPWIGFRRVMDKYEKLHLENVIEQQEQAIASGKKMKGALIRIRIPEPGIQQIWKIGATEKGERRKKAATIALQTVFGWRASTAKLEVGAVSFDSAGWLNAKITTLKNRDIVEEILTLPPGPSDDDTHPRNIMFKFVRAAQVNSYHCNTLSIVC